MTARKPPEDAPTTTVTLSDVDRAKLMDALWLECCRTRSVAERYMLLAAVITPSGIKHRVVDRRLVVWLAIGGRKPLAHLPRWKRRLLHVPSVRWRLWPRPWNFNGPTAGYRRECRYLRNQRNELYDALSYADYKSAERIMNAGL